ncbi:hypothetical protein [Sinorhizobium fredii]
MARKHGKQTVITSLLPKLRCECGVKGEFHAMADEASTRAGLGKNSEKSFGRINFLTAGG